MVTLLPENIKARRLFLYGEAFGYETAFKLLDWELAEWELEILTNKLLEQKRLATEILNVRLERQNARKA